MPIDYPIDNNSNDDDDDVDNNTFSCIRAYFYRKIIFEKTNRKESTAVHTENQIAGILDNNKIVYTTEITK